MRLNYIAECSLCGEKNEAREIKKHIKKSHDEKYISNYITIKDVDCPCCGKESVYEYNNCPSCGLNLFEIKRELWYDFKSIVNDVVLLGWSINSKDIVVQWSKINHDSNRDYNVTWSRTDMDRDHALELPSCLSGFIERDIIKKLDKKISEENGWKSITLDKYLEELNS